MSCRRLRRPGCAALLAACLGCALPGPQARILLPDPPGAWRARFAGLACRIVWSEPGGPVHELRLSSWPADAWVELPRAAPTPILAFPVHAGVELLPAGGLSPSERSPPELSWSRGPVAACLLGLCAAGYRLEHLNTGRLLQAVDDLRLEDPWHLDTARLAGGILSGVMRVTDVAAAERSPVALQLPAGEWIPASAGAAALFSDGCAIAQLPDGFHRLFHSALALRADLFVSGAAVSALVTAHPFDGQRSAACYHDGNGGFSWARAAGGQGSLRPSRR